MSAMLKADYRDRTVNALDELRSVILARRAQYKQIARDALDEHNTSAYLHCTDAARLLDTILDDIAIAIQREQGR
jgi:hypothetical protein